MYGEIACSPGAELGAWHPSLLLQVLVGRMEKQQHSRYTAQRAYAHCKLLLFKRKARGVVGGRVSSGG